MNGTDSNVVLAHSESDCRLSGVVRRILTKVTALTSSIASSRAAFAFPANL